jgi:hypothetical protein
MSDDTARIPCAVSFAACVSSHVRAGTHRQRFGVDAQTQAAGDLMCLQPAGMFDAARAV